MTGEQLAFTIIATAFALALITALAITAHRIHRNRRARDTNNRINRLP